MVRALCRDGVLVRLDAHLPPSTACRLHRYTVDPTAEFRTPSEQSSKASGKNATRSAGEPVRKELPGSPFKLLVTAGEASSEGSIIEEIYKASAATEVQQAQRKESPALVRQSTGKVGPPSAAAAATSSGRLVTVPARGSVGAGELLLVRPLIRDGFGNPAAAKDGELRIVVQPPDDRRQFEIVAYAEVKGGLTTYEARFEPKVMGETSIYVTLSGLEIVGSPFLFEVLAGIPDTRFSRFIIPEPPLFATQPYEIKLVCHDKYDNACRVSPGSSVAGRLQGPNMPPGQDTNCEVVDTRDGSYTLHVTLKGPSDVKLNASIAREVPQPNAEFPPISLSFLSIRLKGMAASGKDGSKHGGKEMRTSIDEANVGDEAVDADKEPTGEATAEGEAPVEPSTSSSPSFVKRRSSLNMGKLRGAVDEIVSGLGVREERRSRKVAGSAQSALEVAVSAFASAGNNKAARRAIQ